MPTTRIPGFVLTDHVVELPLDHATPDDGRTIEVFSREVVPPGSTVHTGGARGAAPAGRHGLHPPLHHRYNAADRSAVLPGAHLIASLLKRWIAGTLHHRVSNEQLPYYLDQPHRK